MLTIMFKIVLRTFEAEILKILKNIQAQLKNWTFLQQKSVKFPSEILRWS